MTQINRVHAGVPAGGQFASHERTDAVATLSVPHAVNAIDLQAFIDAARADHGLTDITWGDLADLADVDHRMVSAIVDYGDPEAFPEAVRARAHLEGLDTPVPPIATRYAAAPFSADTKQHVAGQSNQARLTEFEGVHHNTVADFADVDEDGILYGIHIDPKLLAATTGIAQADGEEDDDYLYRLVDESPKHYAHVRSFLKEYYGADLIDDGGSTDIACWHVPFPDGDSALVTIEWMGAEATSTTGLQELKQALAWEDVFAEQFRQHVASAG